MLSVIVGALISMTTTAGVATFQWYTTKAERHRVEQAESLSQFAGAVGGLASLQGRIHYIAERLALLSARANLIAAAAQNGDKQVASGYDEFVKLAWEVTLDEATLVQDIGKNVGAASLAYYRLSLAFSEIEPVGFFPFPESNAGTYILGASPDPQELRRYATDLDGRAQGLLGNYNWVGQWANKWSNKVAELKRGIKM
jgi:hypothetical protein